MAIRQTTRCCSAVALIALLASSSAAQTPVPAARAIKQTRSADDKTPLPLFPLRTVWTLSLNNALTAPPAFRGPVAVFALEGEQLAAYDLAKGSRLWVVPMATTVEPAVGADQVFVAERNALAALSLANGELLWNRPVDAAVVGAPAVEGDRVFLATSDGDIVAMQAADGEEMWRQHLAAAVVSRPALTATRVFVATADKQVIALNVADGSIAWNRTLPGVGRDILVDADRIFLGSQDRSFYCLSVTDGEIQWRWPTGADTVGLPEADDRTVYFVALDNLLRGLNRSSGVQRWKSALPFRPVSGPLKWSETLVVAGTEPLLQGFSAKDGKSFGRETVSMELSAAPYLFVDHAQVFPTLVTIASDIVGRATVTGSTRDIEPAAAPPLAALPNATPVATVPNPPPDLGAVSALPNLTRVAPPAEP